jgi:hypothetical protein
MQASLGGVAGQKIKISQKFSGFEKLLLVGGICNFRACENRVIYVSKGQKIERQGHC